MSYLRHRPGTVAPDIKKATDAEGTQDVFSQVMRQTQDTNRNIYDDLSALDSRTNGVVYFGDPDTDGTWRITVDGLNLAVQLRTAGVWVEKHAFTP